MHNSKTWMLAGVSALTLMTGAAHAQATGAAQQPAAEPQMVGEVIVTARRTSENLQNVPTTVSAVSGDSLKKLAITQFQDVAAVVPGLSLGTSSVTAGRSPAPSIRGVSYDASTQASPTVDIYQNDVPIDGGTAFQAVYDIQAIEVLRGPQGTLRGRTAPSGAITLTTRRADTHDFGGYVSALATDHGGRNAQGAVNIPLIDGVLGVRLAGVVDENKGDFVTSINSSQLPLKSTRSGRISINFTPTDNFDAMLSYQKLNSHKRSFTQVAGDGAPGGISSAAPAGYNGPVITASQRLDVDDSPRFNYSDNDFLSTQLNWSVLGHRLSYVGGYTKGDSTSIGALDYGNFLIGRSYFQNLTTNGSQTTHEIRLSSDNKDSLIEYTLGYFYSKAPSKTGGTQPASFLAGAFGSPGAPADPRLLDTRYMLPTLINVDNHATENSVFANVRVHLGERTELSGGVRHIVSKVDNVQTVFLGAGMIARRIGFPCSAAGFASSYGGGYCDIPIAAGTTPVQNSSQKNTEKPTVYNLSISHRFSDQVLSYGTFATSWRRGANNFALTNAENDPVLASLIFLPDEKSKSFETGVKTNWLDRRLRLNLAVFYQKYDGLLFQLASIPYLGANGATVTLQNSTFNVGADSIVKGFDFDGAFQVTPNWSISGGVSYADGKVDNDTVPCRDSNFDGVPDKGAPTFNDFRSRNIHVATCKSNVSVSRDPKWTGTLQSEYWRPVGRVEGYVRGLLSYYPKNNRRNVGYTVPDYGLLNVFAGVRSPDGAWDVNLFARNLTKTDVQTSRDTDYTEAAGGVSGYFGVSGYRWVSNTPPREVGVSVRYAFGVR
ncbi:TonB-dependent receptor [Caulobacter sp. BK020]|uniref:TonB-dependent receptor n=1 Tax=Caulobacter sp. BK020 TaxID=2512117 RepID=UPI0010DA37CB|nr:TonB-dependent receptor [Caulobacter sp. BK020]TCS14937.1 iron complex outermembrane receptor protein [Caulobacter sp. BK020]